MRIIPILSAGVIVIGCFMPCIQIGLLSNRLIDNSDGAIVLIAGVIAGGVALYNQSQNKSQNTWVYFVVGIIGLFCAYFYFNEVVSKSKKIVYGINEFNSFIGNDKDISMMNFVGSGLYIVSAGSIGLILCGFDIFDPDNKPTAKIVEEKIANETIPEYVEKNIEEKTEEEIVKEDYRFELQRLNRLIVEEQNSIFGEGMTEKILQIINELCQTQQDAFYLLNTYQTFFKSDLIDDLKKVNSSYAAIKKSVSKFIEFDIIEEKSPHSPKTQRVLQEGKFIYVRG